MQNPITLSTRSLLGVPRKGYLVVYLIAVCLVSFLLGSYFGIESVRPRTFPDVAERFGISGSTPYSRLFETYRAVTAMLLCAALLFFPTQGRVLSVIRTLLVLGSLGLLIQALATKLRAWDAYDQYYVVGNLLFLPEVVLCVVTGALLISEIYTLVKLLEP